MGEAIITRRGGGRPKPPTSWTFFQLLSDSRTWVTPIDGWYKIYCVGKSGNGGSGGEYAYHADSKHKALAGGGAGGNSGGVGISQLFLRAGTAVPVTVSTSVSSFGSYLHATAGGNGGNGSNGVATASIAIPGAGGVPSPVVGNAYGGNILNSSGLQGGAGGSATDRYGVAGTSMGGNTGGASGNALGGGGGSGNNMQSLGSYAVFVDKYGGRAGGPSMDNLPQSGWGDGAAIQSPPLFKGSGGGGGGSGSWQSYHQPGGLGSLGAIIIEKGV